MINHLRFFCVYNEQQIDLLKALLNDKFLFSVALCSFLSFSSRSNTQNSHFTL